MKIDKERLNRYFWFEDCDGNVIDENSVKDFDYVTYHTCFPLQITERIDEYCYHPKNLFVKHLCYIFKNLKEIQVKYLV